MANVCLSRRRACAAATDFALLVLAAVVVCLAVPNKAHAYVDPSVMTYTIQALAGVAVALSAVLGVALRRTRKVLFKALNIDENAGKIVDPLWARTNGGQQAAAQSGFQGADEVGAAAISTFSENRLTSKTFSPSWKYRLVASAVVTCFFVYTLFVVAPYEVVASSDGSLIYGLSTVWTVMAKGALLIAVVAIALLTLLRGMAFHVVLMLTFSAGLGCYLQAMFMNSGLPIADGATINWADYTTIAVVSAAVWLVVMVAPLVLSLFKQKQAQLVVGALSAVLILVQTVGVVSIFVSQGEKSASDAGGSASEYVMTKDGLYSVSDRDNVIVFVLDTFDTQFLLDSYNAHPEMFDEFTGFTWFTDSVGSMVPTRYGVPFLLTGQYPREDEGFQTFLRERYQRSSYLDDIEAAGYSIGLYTDTLGTEYLSSADAKDLIYDKTINIKPNKGFSVDGFGVFKALTQCALYRDLPWMAKPFFWFYTDQINQMMSGAEGDLATTPYAMNDALWLDQLQGRGLSVDQESGNGAFRLIHLTGTHWPYSLNEVGDFVGENQVTIDQQSQGSIYMVAEYLRQLKEMGLYDEATVIVTADHGDYYPITGPLEEPTSPILLVKPSQNAEQASSPFRISSAPVCASDVLPTVIEALGKDSRAYGRTVFEVAEGEARTRYYLETINNDTGDVAALQYAIDGYALDMSNWNLTGKVWNIWE